MEDKNLHINQSHQVNYPEPDIPADDAWRNMSDMLDAQAPPPSSGPGGGKMGKGFWKFFVLIIIVSSVIVWIINKSFSKNEASEFADEEKNIVSVHQNLKDTNSSTSTNTLSAGNNEPNKNLNKVPNTLDSNSFQLNPSNSSSNADKNLNPLSSTTTNSTDPKIIDNIENKNKANNTGTSLGDNRVINNGVKNNSPNANGSNRNNINNSNQRSNSDNRIVNNSNRTNNSRNANVNAGNRNNINNSNQRSNSNNRIVNNRNRINNSRTLLQTERVRINTIQNPTSNLKWSGNKIDTSNAVTDLKRLLAIDSSLSLVSNAKENRNSSKGVHYGLQLNVSIPLNKDCMCNYATDANGKDRFYKLFIPSIWLSKMFKDKHEITVQFNPYQQYFTGKKILSKESIYLPPGLPEDTLLAIKSFSTVKTFGWSADIQYSYYFNNKWSAGLGVAYNKQSQALLSKQIDRVYDNQTVFYNVIGHKNDEINTTQYFKPYFISSSINAAYNFKKFQVGARLNMPVTNMLALDSSTSIRPINGQLFFRWKIK